MAKKKQDYGNESISSLKGADRVRLRPAVIFGSDGLSIGACLNQLLILVVQEQLPNHRQTLLDFALREFHL